MISLAAAFVVSSDGVDTWSARSARILTTGIAPLMAFAFWLAVQWQIQGDPLYFVNTSFSGLNFPDTARQAGAGHLLFGGMGSIPQTLVLAAERAANLLPRTSSRQSRLASWLYGSAIGSLGYCF